ncbi:MAG: NnrS family protein [Deltaproteobacteria bacterium]|nr:MAG: NnrS family protein [Deltaproteobacteria bacterium]
MKNLQLPTLSNKPTTAEPYPFLFFMGWIFGAIGSALWPLLIYGFITFYPKDMHADLMTGAFLVFYSAGFLMTAIPQFTGTYAVTRKEWIGIFFATLLTFSTVFLQYRLPFHILLTINLTLLFLFCARRLKDMTSIPPPSFVFAVTGILIAILSGLGVSLQELTGSFAVWGLIGRNFLYNGFQLTLILGVGLFLIPNLLGHPNCNPGSRPGRIPSQSLIITFIKQTPTPLWILLSLFVFSFLIEALTFIKDSSMIGRGLRVLIFIFVGFKSWQIYRLPKHRSYLSIGLWLSCWSLLTGLLLPLFFPYLEIHMKHLAYIGGYGLMTLMISTRVMLAHSGYDMILERKSRWLLGVVILVLLAATTRTIARWMPEVHYLNHLNYAACAWMLALVCWAMTFRKK